MVVLKLPNVTLCAAASVNVPATVMALRSCLSQADFAECLLFTDAKLDLEEEAIRLVAIPRLTSAEAYSRFLLGGLVDHVRTDHCLIVQWDGFILDSNRWEEAFLSFDYIGAPWPQFHDGHDVGNGGFSLRSRRLLEACLDPRFRGIHPEDVTICRWNREFLELEHGICFADRATAQRFAYERTPPVQPSFGFHGIFNMLAAVGPDPFWEIYQSLDDRRTVLPDFWLLARQLASHRDALERIVRLSRDMVAERLRLVSP